MSRVLIKKIWFFKRLRNGYGQLHVFGCFLSLKKKFISGVYYLNPHIWNLICLISILYTNISHASITDYAFLLQTVMGQHIIDRYDRSTFLNAWLCFFFYRKWVCVLGWYWIKCINDRYDKSNILFWKTSMLVVCELNMWFWLVELAILESQKMCFNTWLNA